MWIDADERLSPELQKNMRSLLMDEAVDSYAFLWPYVDKNGNRVGEKTRRYKKILCRRKKMYQIGLSHIQAEVWGRTVRVPYVLEHRIDNISKKGILKMIIKKNIKIGKITAGYLVFDFEKIPTFRCTLSQKNIKHRFKLMFMKNHPLLAIVLVPVRSFIGHYFSGRSFRDGYLGFVRSLEVPSYHFFTSYYVLKYKLFGKKSTKNE